MKITLNGDDRQISSRTLSDLMDECDYAEQIVATALNGEFVPIPERQDHMLQDGDRIEVLAPMQGG